jgi:sugar phosphate permease
LSTPAEPTRKLTSRIFYGWYIVAGAASIAAMNSALFLQAFGAYVTHLETTFGWSRTLLAGAYAAARLESGVMGPLEGWLVDKLGPRIVMRVGIIMVGIGFILLSQVHNVPFYYGAIFIISIGTALTHFLTVAATLSRWFVRHRTKAIAFALAGSSVGGFLGVPIVALALDEFGWRTTAFASGLIVLAVGLPLSGVFRYTPESYGLRPDGDPVHEGEKATQAQAAGAGGGRNRNRPDLEGFTLRQAFRTRAFWLMGFGQASATLAQSMIAIHLIPFLTDEYDLSTTTAAPIFSVVLASTFACMILGGFISDKLNKRYVAATAMLGTGVGMFILSTTPPLGFIFVFAVLTGGSSGFRFPLMGAIRADYFGRKQIGTILGWSTFLSAVGNSVGPVFGGLVKDISGSYEGAFFTVATISAIGALFFVFASKPTLPVQTQAASASQPST